MDRQAFIDNFLVAHDTYVIGGVEKANSDVKMFLALIGCVYDLQQQIAQKDSFNLDGSPVKRTQNLICQSCGKPLALSEVHPDNWMEIE